MARIDEDILEETLIFINDFDLDISETATRRAVQRFIKELTKIYDDNLNKSKYVQSEQVKIAFDEIKNKLSEAIRLIAEHDIELLSYKGQTLFNQLSNRGE